MQVLLRALLVGYYGYGNLGDELLLKASRCILKESGLHLVEALYPRETKLGSITTRSRFSISKIIDSIKHTDIVVFGGGGVLQDETSFRSFFYYYSIARFATFLKRHVIFLGNSFGPLKRRISRYMFRRLAKNKYVHFFPRDPVSERYIAMFTDRVFRGTDLAIGVLQNIRPPLSTSDRKTILIAPRKMKNWMEVVRTFKTEGYDVHFIVSSPEDWECVDTSMRTRVCTGIPIDKIASSSLIISERFHPSLIAAYYGVPFISVRSKKTERFFKNLLPKYEGFADRDPADIMYKTSKLIGTKLEIKERLNRRFKRMVENFRQLILNL